MPFFILVSLLFSISFMSVYVSGQNKELDRDLEIPEGYEIVEDEDEDLEIPEGYEIVEEEESLSVNTAKELRNVRNSAQHTEERESGLSKEEFKDGFETKTLTEFNYKAKHQFKHARGNVQAIAKVNIAVKDYTYDIELVFLVKSFHDADAKTWNGDMADIDASWGERGRKLSKVTRDLVFQLTGFSPEGIALLDFREKVRVPIRKVGKIHKEVINDTGKRSRLDHSTVNPFMNVLENMNLQFTSMTDKTHYTD